MSAQKMKSPKRSKRKSPKMSLNIEFSTVDALWALIQNQTKSVRKALVKRILDDHEQQRTLAQQKMVKDSLTRAFDELHSGKIRHNARDLFKK